MSRAARWVSGPLASGLAVVAGFGARDLAAAYLLILTGIQDIVTATGINRSSLYATLGEKKKLYRAALRRYVEQRSQPLFDRLSSDERSLAAISDFFSGLIRARCSGEYARWGCMVANAHTGAENDDPRSGGSSTSITRNCATRCSPRS